MIERGYPKPISVYEFGAQLPLLPRGKPFIGTLPIPVFIQKDGTVKLQRGISDNNPIGDIFKELYKTVAKWKFQPYLVDGQPVDADYYVPYEADGKPYVPSYKRPSAPGDDVAGAHP